MFFLFSISLISRYTHRKLSSERDLKKRPLYSWLIIQDERQAGGRARHTQRAEREGALCVYMFLWCGSNPSPGEQKSRVVQKRQSGVISY